MRKTEHIIRVSDDEIEFCAHIRSMEGWHKIIKKLEAMNQAVEIMELPRFEPVQNNNKQLAYEWWQQERALVAVDNPDS